ncbi:MAG: hypothetical protein AAGC53_12625 [Actinomycetota bacterium]
MGGGSDSNTTTSRRSVGPIIVVFVALVAGVVGRELLTDETWDPVSAEPPLPPSASGLGFTTPADALDHFVRAVNDGQFDLAADMLSQQTRADVGGNLDISGLTTRSDDSAAELLDIRIDDANFLPNHMVARMAELAAVDGSLPIDLRGGITNRTTTTIGGGRVHIEGTLASGTGVTAVMTQNAADEWRVEQLRVDGGDPDHLPFSAPPGQEPPPQTADDVARYADRIVSENAEGFAIATLRLVEADDFFTLERVLSSKSLLGVGRGLGRLDISQLATFRARSIFAGYDLETLAAVGASWDGLLADVWRSADALGAMYVDPVGPYSVESSQPSTEDATHTIVDITDNAGITYRVTVVEVEGHGWRLEQILALGGDPDTLPLSGPTGIEAPPGAVVCWDHVRYEGCDQTHPIEQARIQELRDLADAGELAPAVAAAEITKVRAELPLLDGLCATMQGNRNDLVFSKATIDLAPSVVEDYCPGEPSLLVLDPDG